MMDITMNNETNNKISSRGRKMRIFRKILLVLNILLLIAAVVIAAMVLTGCSKEPETFPEAEAAVQNALNEIKNNEDSEATFKKITELAGTKEEGEALSGYIDKLKEFEYELVNTTKLEDGKVCVTARITTYDFGNAYISTWNEFIQMNDSLTKENEFISNLMFKCASMTKKDFVTDVDIICTDPKGDGNWETDVKNNESLMNALSGGMVDAMKSIAEDSGSEEETDAE